MGNLQCILCPPQYEEKKETLSRHFSKLPLLWGLTGAQLHAIESILTLKTYQKGDYLTRIDEDASFFWFIIQGECKAFNEAGDGVSYFADGDYFGEYALINNCSRRLTIRAHTIVSTLRCNEVGFAIISNFVKFGTRGSGEKISISKFNLLPNKFTRNKTEMERKWLKFILKDYVTHSAHTDYVVNQMWSKITEPGEIISEEIDNDIFYVVDGGEFAIYENNVLCETKKSGDVLKCDIEHGKLIRSNTCGKVWACYKKQLSAANIEHFSENYRLLQQEFNTLLRNEVEEACKVCDEKYFKQNSIILQPDEELNYFYIVKSGKVSWRDEMTSTLYPNEKRYFGAYLLIEKQNTKYSLIATTNCILLMIKKEYFFPIFHTLQTFFGEEAPVNEKRDSIQINEKQKLLQNEIEILTQQIEGKEAEVLSWKKKYESNTNQLHQYQKKSDLLEIQLEGLKEQYQHACHSLGEMNHGEIDINITKKPVGIIFKRGPRKKTLVVHDIEKERSPYKQGVRINDVLKYIDDEDVFERNSQETLEIFKAKEVPFRATFFRDESAKIRLNKYVSSTTHHFPNQHLDPNTLLPMNKSRTKFVNANGIHNCMVCDVNFHDDSSKKHHCRSCGRVICDSCSKTHHQSCHPMKHSHTLDATVHNACVE